MKMKSTIYAGLRQFLKDNQPELATIGKKAAIAAMSGLDRILTEREEQSRFAEKIENEFYNLTGHDMGDELRNYVKSAIPEGYQRFKADPKAAYTFAVSRLEKAKIDFQLEQKVIDYVNTKIEELKKKL